jgi:hypothetical protein
MKPERLVTQFEAGPPGTYYRVPYRVVQSHVVLGHGVNRQREFSLMSSSPRRWGGASVQTSIMCFDGSYSTVVSWKIKRYGAHHN